MTKNEGVVDLAIRLIAGLAVIGAAPVVFGADGTLAWDSIGILPSATGLVGWGAVYWLLAISMLVAWAALERKARGSMTICASVSNAGASEDLKP